MSTQMQNNDFLLNSINESIEDGANVIATEFALNRLNMTGSVNIQECKTIYLMAKEILTEGSEDLIPDNIELPDNSKMGEEELDEDLDVSDLEGIVLPTADGGLMVVENGVLVPYSEEPAVAPVAPVAPDASENEEENPAGGVNIQESETNIEGTSNNTEGLTENTSSEVLSSETIQESESLSSHSSIVNSMIQQLNFKGGF